LGGLVAQVPENFQFAFKVTDEITIKRFPNLPRFGSRAGQTNANFLSADVFASAFLSPCAPFRRNVGLLIFEFSRFSTADFAQGRDVVEALDVFLAKLPCGWPYGVEIRNRTLLRPEYFAVLARHGVTHVLNSWEAMPSVAEQLALPESLPRPELAAMRLLLRPGRRYEEAVKLFAPYSRLKEQQPESRAAAMELIRAARQTGRPKQVFVYVNNRFVGNALGTIADILEKTATN
jgi:uncharacterized protein YecE (DUF72 family)